jgi:hypothetical protein
MAIDLKELRQAIRDMTRQQGIYKVLRDELIAKGYWHKLPRGNPRKGYEVMKQRKKAKL